MPSNKNKVSVFLSDGELKAFERLKKKHASGNTEAFVSLLNKEAVHKEFDLGSLGCNQSCKKATEQLNKQVESVYLADEEVASHVGARVETVKEWRLGLRKPRGKNIKAKLKDVELYFGKWRVSKKA